MPKADEKVFVFPDTNIFLEFKDFDQIDWRAVFNVKRVVLVVAPVILTELERFKYDQKSERRQSRSRRITKLLNQIIFSSDPNEEAEVQSRQGVTLLAITDSPRLSQYLGLEEAIADDHLIASILDFKAKHPEIDSNNLLLIGDDAGCLNKARARGIRVKRLDDDLRLNNEPSASEKEVSQLRRQLQELRNLQPKLKIAVASSPEPLESVASEIVNLIELDKSKVDELCLKEEQATVWSKPKPPAQAGSDEDSSPHKILGGIRMADLAALVQAGGGAISDAEVSRYQREREQYLISYRQFLSEIYQYKEAWQRSVRLPLLLINDGTVPATGVIVRVIIPDDIEVFTDEDLPDAPKRPRRPALPRTEMQIAMDSMRMAAYLPSITPASFYSGNIDSIDPDLSGPDITPYNSMLVTWKRSKVTHHIPLALDSLILRFTRFTGVKEYTINYQIIADNTPEPVKGSIRISIESKEATMDLEK